VLIATGIAATGRAKPITLAEFGVSGSPPNYLHEGRLDYRYWDAVLEP
jgi:hypothetical protein